MAQTYLYSKKEEVANAITHGFGVILSIIALILLLVRSISLGEPSYVLSFTIFGSTMLLLYVCSTMLHSLPEGKAKNLFEILDHASIYLFIAGTYTPILLITVRGGLGWTVFCVIWGIALFGIVFKIFFVKRFMILSTLGYIVMGWIAVFVLKPIVEAMPIPGVILLFTGGIFYTVGCLFYVWRKVPHHHAIWHGFVLVGSACHFFMIWKYI